MQTVKSAKEPFATMSAKCSLFNRVTVLSAAVTTRSLARKISVETNDGFMLLPVETFEAAEKTVNMVLQSDRML